MKEESNEIGMKQVLNSFHDRWIGILIGSNPYKNIIL